MGIDPNMVDAFGTAKPSSDALFQSSKVSDVKKATDGLKVVDESIEVAKRLSGSAQLEKDLKEARDERNKSKDELDRERQKALETKIDDLKKEMLRAPDSRLKQLEDELKEAKEKLHQEQLHRVEDELKELRQARNSGSGDIIDQIKRAKDLAKELGLSGKETPETPPDILIQLKKMDFDLQVKLAEMTDERNRRDKEWALTVKKWDDERDLRRKEVEGKLEIDRDRTTFIRDGIEKLGRVVVSAMSEGEEGEVAETGRIASQHIEANEGEYGEFPCPNCKALVPIARDAQKAICPNCETIYPIKRIKPEPTTS